MGSNFFSIKQLQPLLRNLGYIGLLLSVAYTITGKNYDWLVYTGLPLMVIGISYNIITDWKSGKKNLVVGQLVGLMIIFLLLWIIFQLGK
ncbi:MAG: hypothetical protein JWP69_381 [Flaviaesturariibacter sp.]|nr:hypothetical protein [Flaviaesturariibacter sp.]